VECRGRTATPAALRASPLRLPPAAGSLTGSGSNDFGAGGFNAQRKLARFAAHQNDHGARWA